MVKGELLLLTEPNKKPSLLIKEVENIIKSFGGIIEITDEWGTKKLAYPVYKNESAYYTIIDFYVQDKSSKLVDELVKFCGKDESVLKHIVIKRD